MRTQMFMLALVLSASARGVEAQAHTPMRLRYDAPAVCPDRGFFAERMRARLDAEGVRKLASLSLHVTLEAGDRTVRGEVEIERGDTRARRELAGTDCREVVEGLALITSLAVASPDAAPERAKRRKPSESPRSAASTAARDTPPLAPPPTSTSTTTSTSAQTSLGETGPREAAAPERATPAPETEPQPRAAQAAVTGPHDEAPAIEDPPEATARSVGRDFSVGVAALAIHGVAPALQPGLQLQAAWVFAHGALDWSLQVGGRVALPDREQSSAGLARFGFFAGVVQLCASGPLGAQLSLSGCAVAEPGLLTARGEDTRNPRDYSRAWLAAGAAAGLGWRAADWLALRLGAEAVAPFRRDRMILAGELLHRVPAACLRVLLAVEVPLG